MGKYEKLIQQWSKNPPATASKEDILNLLQHYGHEYRSGKGSHYVVTDKRLKNSLNFIQIMV
jgi:hypothetical protein